MQTAMRERPSAINGLRHAGAPVFAMAGEPNDIVALARAFDAFNGETARSIQALQASMSSIVTELTEQSEVLAALRVGSAAPGSKRRDPALAALDEFARKGGNQDFGGFYAAKMAGDVNALASVGSDPDGGYTVLPDFDNRIRVVARDQNSMRSLATVIPTLRNEYQILVDPSLSACDWVGERDARPKTDAPKLKRITIPTHEIYANPAATQTLLDDSSADIAAWLSDSVSRSFALKEGTAFFSGDGANKPRGFLTYDVDTAEDFVRQFDKLQYVATGATSPTSSQLVDALIAVSLKVRTPYRANARWIMHRETARVIRQLKDAQDRPLWTTDGQIVEGQPDRLLGWPVSFQDDMPTIASNALAVAVGDWRQGYAIVDRIGIRVLRDPYTDRPNILFYTTKRVGGSVIDFNAIKILKWAA